MGDDPDLLENFFPTYSGIRLMARERFNSRVPSSRQMKGGENR
jgi:hypothetical protein